MRSHKRIIKRPKKIKNKKQKENKNKGKIIDGFKESTQAAHAIGKENLQAEKTAARERHEAYTEPHPGMEEFKEAKGLKGKMKAAFKGMKESADQVKEGEGQFRDDAIHLRGTQETLKNARENREAMTKRGY